MKYKPNRLYPTLGESTHLKHPGHCQKEQHGPTEDDKDDEQDQDEL